MKRGVLGITALLLTTPPYCGTWAVAEAMISGTKIDLICSGKGYGRLGEGQNQEVWTLDEKIIRVYKIPLPTKLSLREPEKWTVLIDDIEHQGFPLMIAINPLLEPIGTDLNYVWVDEREIRVRQRLAKNELINRVDLTISRLTGKINFSKKYYVGDKLDFSETFTGVCQKAKAIF